MARSSLTIIALLAACAAPVLGDKAIYAAFQEKHGDIDMVSPAKVAILLTDLGLAPEEAARFENAGVNGAMLRLADDALLTELGFSGTIEKRRIMAWVATINAVEVEEDKTESKLFYIILALFLPPVAVSLVRGCGAVCCCNAILTSLAGVPGIIHAVYVITHPASKGSSNGPGWFSGLFGAMQGSNGVLYQVAVVVASAIAIFIVGMCAVLVIQKIRMKLERRRYQSRKAC